MPIVDIIIPLYNKARTVERTIQSVLQQTFTDWRLIVVNDGSTDDSVEVVNRFDDPRICLVTQDNQGPGAARNQGIRRADADYIAFLDADDQWYPWYLENSIKSFDTDDIGFVGSMYYEWPAQVDMTEHWSKRNVREGAYAVDKETAPKQIESWFLFFHVGTTVVKRDLALKYDGFYDKGKCLTGEDTIFFAKLVMNEKFKIIAPPAVRHNRQDSDLSSTQIHPITPALTTPGVVTDYCPDDKKALARAALAHLALRTAHHKARNGLKHPARQLLADFPEVRKFGRRYWQCRLEIVLSRWMPYWVRFKVKTGPPVRLFLRKLACRTGLLKPPPNAETEPETAEG